MSGNDHQAAARNAAVTRFRILLALALLGAAPACKRKQPAVDTPGAGGPGAERPLTIGVAFETLQTEYWMASFEEMKRALAERNIRVHEAIADSDPNRQLEQIQGFIARKVDGIIVAPKDAQMVLPAIKAANTAGVPIVLYNRPPAPSDAKSVTVAVDNHQISKATVEHLCRLARAGGGKRKALILIGDLGDMNAVRRRDGFEDAAKSCADGIEVVSRVPTEWNQEKALAGVTSALQAHPDMGIIFSSSDFMLPSITSALKAIGKYKKAGEPGHVLLGSFDGDATAYEMLRDGYLDADGVQDAAFQSRAAVQAVLDLRAGKVVQPLLLDPGLIIHRENLEQEKSRMWGALIADRRAGAASAPAK
jgi:inositol transport system substrate-binding protein